MELKAAARLRASFSPSTVEDYKLALQEVLEHLHLPFSHLVSAPFLGTHLWCATLQAPAEDVVKRMRTLDKAFSQEFLTGNIPATAVTYQATEEFDNHSRIRLLQSFLVVAQDQGCVVYSVDRRILKRVHPELK